MKNKGKQLHKDEVFEGELATSTHRAAADGDTQLLVAAVKLDPESLQQKDNDGYTPLAHAVLGKHLSAVKRLVKMGADVNVQDARGRTCLSVAAYQGWTEGLIYLLRKGARQDIVDKAGRTPLHAATYDTEVKPLVTLMKRLTPEEVNVSDNEGMAALHWAAFHDRPDHVRQLLHYGATISRGDIDGKTALHWAAQNGSRECCLHLLHEPGGGCDLTSQADGRGKLPVHLATAAGHHVILQDLAEVAPHLCEAGDNEERTPLHWAAATGHASCVKVLLGIGVSPEPQDMDGVTPLEYASNAGHTECKTLIINRLRLDVPPTSDKASYSGDGGGGFFRGLFSKKKQVKDAKKVPSITVLPDAVTTSRPTEHGGKRQKPNAALGQSKTVSISVGESGMRKSVAGGPVEDVERLEGPSRTKKKQGRHKNSDVESSTSLHSHGTDKLMKDNGSISTTSRGIHLSPLGGYIPPAFSPTFSPSPLFGERDPQLKRLGELKPLRIDRLMNDRMDIPLLPPNDARTRLDPEDISPTPGLNTSSPPKKTGRAILPEIGGTSLPEDTNETSDNKKKKKKKHRKEKVTPVPIEDRFFSKFAQNSSALKPEVSVNEYEIERERKPSDKEGIQNREVEEFIDKLDLSDL
ncbi:ankyrin repeat domain-containing protein 55-like isoform X2 [Mya arenaria]|uniref:ankyrin repeat domain-containing protein 55-like isoform X2 n=1 Tax=Mya arenaria TaxID=6604 RepID=UPI0022E906C3|nr:ankyrin repeat domain-containing protein 55-like isoform X2 [Mya arenaria]